MSSPRCKSKFTSSCVSTPKGRLEVDNHPTDYSSDSLSVDGKALLLKTRHPVNNRLRRTCSSHQVDVLRSELLKAKIENQRTLSALDRIMESSRSSTLETTCSLSRSLDEDMFRNNRMVKEKDNSESTVKTPTVVFNRAKDTQSVNKSSSTKHVWVGNSGAATTDIMDIISPKKYHGFTETSDSEMENVASGSAMCSMESLQDEMSCSSDDNGGDSQVSSLTIESYASAQDHSSAKELIDNMWDDFSIESYMANEGKVIDVTKLKQANGWYPRVTVPKPFSMTLREQNAKKKPSQSAMEAEREKLEKEVQEEFELNKKFRAIPVPASTYLPLYQLIVAENEQRRAQVKQTCKAMLKATERPFSFVKRDEEQNKQKQMLTRKQEHPVGKKVIKPFVAKPAPTQLFSNNREKYREEEIYRKIKKKVRSRELLLQSKLPKNMQVKGREYTVGALRKRRLEEREKKAFLTEEHNFHPKITANVPDYVQSHTENEIQLARSKQFNRNTTVEPFNLKTQLLPSRIDKVYEDIARDDENLPETRWPYKSPRIPVKPNHSRSFSGPSQYSTMTTEGSRLWEAANKKKLASLIQKEVEEERNKMERQRRQQDIQKRVSDRVKSGDKSGEHQKSQKEKQAAFRSVTVYNTFNYSPELPP